MGIRGQILKQSMSGTVFLNWKRFITLNKMIFIKLVLSVKVHCRSVLPARGHLYLAYDAPAKVPGYVPTHA